MFNDLLGGITSAIYTKFGDTYEIYTTKIEQGLMPPCFFVRLLNPKNEMFLGRRRCATTTAVIQYFSEETELYKDFNDTYEDLIDCLEEITVGSDSTPLRGQNFEYNIEDGVLTVMVDYDFYIYVPEEEETMQTIEIDGGVYGD